MPPFTTRLGGRFSLGRLLLGVALLVVLAAGVLVVRLGAVLHEEDPLAPADAIFVLAGARMDRVLEGADLHREGWAPVLLLSQELLDGGEQELVRRGVPYRAPIDQQIDVLVRLGVPRDRIQILTPQVSTASEGASVLSHARAQGWSRLIVVTSKFHTARTGLTMRRYFSRSGVTVIVRASRYDASDVDRWWARRTDLRFVLFESLKYAAYVVGVAD